MSIKESVESIIVRILTELSGRDVKLEDTLIELADRDIDSIFLVEAILVIEQTLNFFYDFEETVNYNLTVAELITATETHLSKILEDVTVIKRVLRDFEVDPETTARVTGQTTWKEITEILGDDFMSFITRVELDLRANITDEMVARNGTIGELHLHTV